MSEDYTPYQQKIIRRYYQNQDAVLLQRLAELVSELYLSEGKKLERNWKTVGDAMKKLGVPPPRVEHLLKARDPALIAGVVKELQRKP